MLNDNFPTKMTCPNCGTPANVQARFCESCGIDLALAVGMAEQAVNAPALASAGVPLAPEILVPRMGDHMIRLGIITSEQLQCALDYQKDKSKAGKDLLLGQALMELGMIDRETLDRVITTQIYQLQNALREANRVLEQRVQERTLDLQHALARVTELNQLKSNFVSNISHELRTPLTHIKGYVDLLADGSLGPLNADQQDAMSVLKRSGERLERLIDDLIQFSTASRGDLVLNLDQCDVCALIITISERLQPKASAQGIRLTYRLPTRLPPVWADQEKIAWVLHQLLDNAIKFTPNGGIIIVEAWQENGQVKIAVTDTGVGIQPERIKELFEPFHQLDGSSTRRYGGTGLGLALVRRIVEAHGASIKVESIVQKGSHFTFFLPIYNPKEQSVKGPHP